MTVQQEHLRNVLGFVGRSLGRRAELPILAHILLEVSETSMTVTTTDLQLASRETLPVTKGKRGSICIQGATFMEYISSLPGGEISLEIAGQKLIVRGGSFRAAIQGMSPSDFPNLSFTPKDPIEIPGKNLPLLIERVSFAASTDESRKELTGILVSLREKGLRLVATDGYRLSSGTIGIANTGKTVECLIPARSMVEVARLAGNIEAAGGDEPLQLSFLENHVLCVKGGKTLMTQKIDGQFPPFEKIIPDSFTARVLVDKDEVEKATRIASVFTALSTGVMTMAVRPENKQPFILSSRTAELGEQEGIIDASVEGQELTVAFNVRYILDAIHAVDASQVSFEFTGPLKPCKIRGVGEENHFHIVMPVRTQG